MDSKNIVCHVNSSACRVYVTFFYSTTSISFYKSFYTLRVFIYFLQLHFRGHFRTAKSLFYVYTHLRTLICGCTVVSTVLQLHFRGHFRVHFRTSTPTFICGRTATFLFYTYTHLWMYSGLYSAIRGRFCTTFCATSISFYKSFYTFCVFLHFLQLHFRGHFCVHFLHSSVEAQRSLQCYSYIFAAIFVYIFVHPCLPSSVDAQ